MGMFTELYTLTTHTRLAMLISADTQRGLMTISVMPRPASSTPSLPARDLTLTARPEEFDAGFIAALSGYHAKLIPLLEQAAASTQALEASPPASPKPAKAAPKAHTPTKASVSAAAPRCAAVDDSDNDTNPNDDPDRSWMKNRQPELF